MPSRTWYIISKIFTPQIMPKIPPKTSYLGPPERIFKVWELCGHIFGILVSLVALAHERGPFKYNLKIISHFCLP